MSILFSCKDENYKINNERMNLLYDHINYQIIHYSESNEQLFKLNNFQSTNSLIRTDTKSIISFLDSIKNQLIKSAGGYDELRFIKNPRNTSVVERSFYDADSEELVKKIENRIFEYEGKYQFIAFETLHLYEDDPYWSQLPESKRQSFIELFIGKNSDLIFSLQLLSLWQVSILSQEQTFYISNLNKKGANNGEHAGPL